MIEDLFDSISDSVSDLFGNDIEASDAIDALSGISENALDSFLNGDFSSSNVDFTFLFEDASNIVSDNINGMDVGVDNTLESINMTNPMQQDIGILGENDNHAGEVSFGGNYSDVEISKMKDDVERAEYEVSCRKSDVSNWESKVSLNDTPEHRRNGDYSHAVNKLNEAKSHYNDAVSRYNSAKSKLNNAL